MNIDIYKKKNSSEYISVPAGTDMSKISLPEEIQKKFSIVELFKSDVVLDSTKPRIGLDENDIISQISKNGYAIHATKITMTTDMQ